MNAAAASPGQVRFHRLTLRGFGPFRDGVEVEFPAGLGVMVAPNEFGKSTILAGLAAVLFGLPGSTNPRAFGQARFRHRDDPPRFDGEIEFTAADGARYRLARQFDTHRVRLQRVDAGGSLTMVAQATHNPGGRRSTRFVEHLERLLGISSRELFVQTFCVEQPLPDPSDSRRPPLSEEVGRLLSGAGAGSYAGALETLMTRLRELTRRKADLGVAPQNDDRDREVEHLESRIGALEEAIEQGRNQADALQEIERKLASLTMGRGEMQGKLQGVRQARDAWQEWLRLADAYRARGRERNDLRKAAAQADQLEQRIREAQTELRARWPELVDVPPETGSHLARLAEFARSLDQQRRVQSTREAEARQARARGALAAWARLLLLQERLDALDRRLRELAPFQCADPSTLELVRHHAGERARILARLREAEAALRRAEEASARVQDQERQLADAFREAMALQPEVATAIDEKLDLEQRRQELEREWVHAWRASQEARRRRRRALSWAAGAALAGLALGATTSWRMGASPVVAGIIGAVSAAALALVVWRAARREPSGAGAESGTGRLRTLESERSELTTTIARLDEDLGPLAGEPPTRLAELRAQWVQFRRASEALAREKGALPSPEAVEGLRRDLEQARAEMERFEAVLRPFSEHFADISAALRDWEALVAERQRAAGDLEAWRAEHFPGGSAPGTPCRQAGPLWAAVEEDLCQQCSHGDPSSPGLSIDEAVDRLGRFDASFWSDPDAERGRWDAAPEETDQCLRWLARAASDELARASTLAEQARLATVECSRLKAEAEPLAAACGAVLAASGQDPAAALVRWREFAESSQRLASDRDALAQVLKAWDAPDTAALRSRLDLAGDATVSALQSLERLVQAHPALPGPEAVEDRAAAEERLRALEREVAALQQAIDEQGSQIEELRGRQAAIVGLRPINVAGAEVELAALRQRRDELWAQARALAVAYQELRQAAQEFQASHRERLEKTAGDYFASITGTAGRRLRLDETFQVTVVEPDGAHVHPSQVSKGAQDQLYLALRLAIADLMASELVLPFLFDDPFLNCDDQRLRRVRETLQKASTQRQMILMSHRPDFLAWGEVVPCRFAGSNARAAR